MTPNKSKPFHFNIKREDFSIEEYDKTARQCTIKIFLDLEYHCHGSHWALIFCFGGRNIKHELLDAQGEMVRPGWCDLGQRVQEISSAHNLGAMKISPQEIHQLVLTLQTSHGDVSQQSCEQWIALILENLDRHLSNSFSEAKEMCLAECSNSSTDVSNDHAESFWSVSQKVLSILRTSISTK